jgi:outer membrane protein OmpA-like peptidoglycan-associated protein
MRRLQKTVLTLLSAFLIITACQSAANAQRDTLSVFFPFNESTLTEQAAFGIDSAIYTGALRLGQSLRIIGYADAVGADSFNVRLSRERALRVQDHLLQSGFSKEDIVMIVARGESQATAPEQAGGNLADRRVDIVPERKPLPAAQTIHMAGGIRVSVSPPTASSVINLSEVKPGQSLVLNNIYFYPGRHVVRPESDTALKALLAALLAHPGVKIRIEGHVCCVSPYARDAMDDDTHVEELSLNRAAAIRNYLVEHGIAEKRLSIAGYGHRKPVVSPERNEDDANRNRRVEIRVLE